jgi:hypothetical protein
MRFASLSLVGLFVGACFDPTPLPSGADAGTESAGASSESGSSDGDASSSSSDTTPSLDDTGDADSSTGVGDSSDEGSSDTGEDPYAEWAFHREVWVSTTDTPRVGYQVELKLPRDDPFAPGGTDIRVVDDDGVELPIWFDDPGFGDDASIWVKMDLEATTDVRVMIHYGNDDAPSVMDAAAVFELYDDFATLDHEAWTVATGDWIAEDGAIATDVDHATSTWSSDAPMIVEARLLWEGSGIEPSTGIALDSSIGAMGIAGMPVSILTGSFSTEAPGFAAGTWTRVRLERDEYQQLLFALDGAPWGIWDAPIEEPYRIHLGSIHSALEPADVVAIDWLFVRQGGAPPVVTVGPRM